MSVQVVWFKRDLRAVDHTLLVRATAAGPVLCVYILEPALWQQPDAARQHFHFALECLRDLYTDLRSLGLTLQIRVGDAVQVLQDIHDTHTIAALHSHEETGNSWTYQRDQQVGAWCKRLQIEWLEAPQFGVVRRLKHRDLWQPAWNELMAQEMTPPLQKGEAIDAMPHWRQPVLPSADDLGLSSHEPHARQRGGRAAGMAVLSDFLNDRSRLYRGGISSPMTAPEACSRLSPYLSMGCISMREVVQRTRARMEDPDLSVRQRKGLHAFNSRLYWHCHFIQKLESEPDIEWCNMHRGYDGLREPEFNDAHFEALKTGRTGWPLVDACVHMLHATGWLNFRMRAMLVSVAAYPLWLHWRPVGEWLAREFLDYEPGIHWSQLQMQSGTTGINTTRVYNPIKQAQDQDPHGHFVRHWIPAMRRVPDTWLFEPWRMPESVQAQCGVVVGRDIPAPVVDLESAIRSNKQRLHARRQQPEVKAATPRVVRKHASRRSKGGALGARPSRSSRRPSDPIANVQFSLLDD